MKAIATLEELVDHAVAVAQGETTWSDVDILPGAAAIPIRVDGAGWGKYIDARGGSFVNSMQEKLDDVFSSYPGQLPAHAPLIKVEVREGSNELLPFLEPFIRMVIDKVSPEQVVEIIKYGILCVSGIWTIGKSINLVDKIDERRAARKDKEKVLTAMTEQQQQALKVIEKSVDAIRQIVLDDEKAEQNYAKPLKDYVHSLDDNDTVAVAAAPPIEAVHAKKFFKARRRPRSYMRHVACDALLKILGLNFEQPQPRLEIEQNGKKYVAIIERLSDEERQQLIGQVDGRLKKSDSLQLNLRVDAYFNDAGLNRICIVGLGTPRKNVTINSFSDIPHNVSGVFDEFNHSPQE